MSKVVIYLDQNFISDIAKLSLEERKTRVNPLLGEIYTELKTGVDEEKFLSPDSWIHAIETAAIGDEKLQKAIQGYQGYLGQVSLQLELHIKNHQFIEALLKFCNIENPQAEDWRVAFHQNPDKRLENFNVKVRWARPTKNDNDKFGEELARIKDGVKNEKDQYLLEIEAARKHYSGILKYEFMSFLKARGISIEKALSFIDSDAFCEIPNINIYCRMWSKNFTYPRTKEQLPHDFNDISFLSLYLPYCDVIATDAHMKELIQQFGLDEVYQCKIYSIKSEDLKKMKVELISLRGTTAPANQSLFSIVCTKPDGKSMYQVDFLQMMNRSRNKFERTGKYWNKGIYTSVFMTFKDQDETKDPEIEDGHWKLDEDQWADMLISGHNFRRIKILESLSKSIKDIPAHLRGAGTAVIDSDSILESTEDLNYLFYDVEDSIAKNLETSEKFKIPIVYP
jgi:hypothetical protein